MDQDCLPIDVECVQVFVEVQLAFKNAEGHVVNTGLSQRTALCWPYGAKLDKCIEELVEGAKQQVLADGKKDG